ncbi:hypothetical protein CPLU01_06537 [Colletotrichum plurivorum]|uniref:Uncharacterized protein n=1 Tax=Colletotrichum plurivorum TaxID=2175906 RepID=A0A8H6KHK1_9PEZI|nr:hypothetical protein CPLU01_06537 [Colletotrichum plurivorum]
MSEFGKMSVHRRKGALSRRAERTLGGASHQVHQHSLPPLPRTGRRTTAPVRTPSPLMIGTSAFQGTPFHEAHRKIAPDGVHGDLERRPVSTAPPTSTLAALFSQGPGL